MYHVIRTCLKWTFHMGSLLSSDRGSIIALVAAGHTEGPRVLTAQGLSRPCSGACAGRSKSLEPASNHQIASRRATPTRPTGNPTKNIKQHVFACFLLYMYMTTRASPGRLTTSHLERGRLPTLQPRTLTPLGCNRSRASTSFLRALVILSVFTRICSENDEHFR